VQQLLLALIAHLTVGAVPLLTARCLDAWLSARTDASILGTLRHAPTTDDATCCLMDSLRGCEETTRTLVAMLRATPHDPWWRAQSALGAAAAGRRLDPSWLPPRSGAPPLCSCTEAAAAGRVTLPIGAQTRASVMLPTKVRTRAAERWPLARRQLLPGGISLPGDPARASLSG